MNHDVWNPWHGCHKYSAGCAHCYVYRRDESVGRDAALVTRNADFDLPLRRDRRGDYRIPPGRHLYLCLTSDFLLEDADPWRDEIWAIMRQRPDLSYTVITKRIVRFERCLPADWGEGWPNVTVCCTMENQTAAEQRFPVFRELPIARKIVTCEPLLGPIDLTPWLDGRISRVLAGGESGRAARVCDFDWVLALRRQCDAVGVPFTFMQTGANFRKDGRLYRIERRLQKAQAQRAGLDTTRSNA